MQRTDTERKLKELEVNVHISRGQVIALGEARRSLEALWLAAEMDCNLKEVEYTRLSREFDREREDQSKGESQ